MKTNELAIKYSAIEECMINVGEGSDDYIICTGIKSLEQVLELCNHSDIRTEFMEKHKAAFQKASKNKDWKDLIKTYLQNSFEDQNLEGSFA